MEGINYPKIMGILNVTPDSFYDGGMHYTSEKAITQAYNLIMQGADIIDVGGESTRPGFKPVSAEEEINRICPVIEKIAKEGIPISVDTVKPKTAQAALEMGVTIINDVSGKSAETGMMELAERANCKIIFTHNSRESEDDINKNIITEITDYFQEISTQAIKKGIKKENIILDPGIGFGKKFDDNYKILNNVSKFKECGYPVLIGLSRKSMIGNLFNQEEDRLPATLALNSAAFLAGVDIIRVHDVKAHKMAFKALAKMISRDK